MKLPQMDSNQYIGEFFDDMGSNCIYRRFTICKNFTESLGRNGKTQVSREDPPIVMKVTDCGGDAEYVLLTSLSITSKSFNLILFDLVKYGISSSGNPHKTNFYPMVGSYLDIIMSQTKNAVICIAACHFDEELSDEHFLRKDGMIALTKVFEEAETQIKKRTKDWNDESSRIVLISDPETKVFLLSNENKNNQLSTLTSSQGILRTIIDAVVSNPSIIDIKEADDGVPYLWTNIHEKMRERSRMHLRNTSESVHKQANFCSERDSYRWFQELVEQQTKHVIPQELKEEALFLSYLTKILDVFETKNKQDIVQVLMPTERDQPSPGLIAENISNSDIKSISQLKVSSVSTSENRSIKGSSQSKVSMQQDILEYRKDFHIALDYLRLINDIFWFQDYPDKIYPDSDAFVNTSRLFLNRNAKDWYEFIDANEHDHLNNGLIKERSFDCALAKRMNKEKEDGKTQGKVKQFVDPEEFKVFMIEMGIIKRCLLGYDPDKEKKLFIRDNTAKSHHMVNPVPYFFIPSLSNLSIAEAYDNYPASNACNISNVVRDDFKKRNGYEIWFKWNDHCLTTVSLINLFLTQLYTEEKWNIEISTKANIYKERLENRKHNVVSLIEFNPNLVLIEEENATESCFYTDRTIRIFVGCGILKKLKFETINELRKILKKSMLAAQNNITKLVHCEDGDIAFDDGVSLTYYDYFDIAKDIISEHNHHLKKL